MRVEAFALVPFPGLPAPDQIGIAVHLARTGSRFVVVYTLRGSLAGLVIPGIDPAPQRRDQLWKHTCFEWFLGRQGSPDYWEFNLSPAGHWNLYRFTGYRQGMAAEERFDRLPLAIRQTADAFELTLEVDLGALLPPDALLQASFSAVIREASGQESFWACAHTGPQADFHRRDSFLDLTA